MLIKAVESKRKGGAEGKPNKEVLTTQIGPRVILVYGYVLKEKMGGLRTPQTLYYKKFLYHTGQVNVLVRLHCRHCN